jgi:hypothetical protein
MMGALGRRVAALEQREGEAAFGFWWPLDDDPTRLRNMATGEVRARAVLEAEGLRTFTLEIRGAAALDEGAVSLAARVGRLERGHRRAEVSGPYGDKPQPDAAWWAEFHALCREMHEREQQSGWPSAAVTGTPVGNSAEGADDV